ncbi:MAG TPA: PilN domain-containing protein [Vicinamibacterales bacterium]|nr:PilN domain-containing protein [Vicinamibacterales bacterium]
MIRTNLSTRPFYNERSVRTLLLLVAVIVVAFTAFNVSRVLRYSRSDTRLQTQAAGDEARAADLRQQAARLRATVNTKQLESAAVDAQAANDLIDRRTFSWTDLFNRFETTLPDDVRITAVRPKIEKEGFALEIHVVARSIDDINTFLENLEASGAFRNTLSAEEHYDETLANQAGGAPPLLATVLATYMPEAGHAAGASRQSGGARR